MITYKILFVKNRFKDTFKLSKYLDWFKANLPVEIVYGDEITTDFDVTTKPVSNATYSVVVCGDDIYSKLRSVVPEGKYNAVVFIPGNEMDGIRPKGYAPSMPLYPGTDLIQLFKVNDSGKAVNHELFHTFVHRLQRQQVTIEDPMDYVIIDGIGLPYWGDSDMNLNDDTNRSMVVSRININNAWDKVGKIIMLNQIPVVKPPIIPATESGVVTINRTFDNGIQTTGDLSINSVYFCKTLERPWKNNQVNISCIPKGTYDVKWTFSPRFLKYTYEIQGVLGRSGIRIHPGNYFFDVDGCILLGTNFSDINNDHQVDILNSRVTLASFESRMGRKDFKLKIT